LLVVSRCHLQLALAAANLLIRKHLTLQTGWLLAELFVVDDIFVHNNKVTISLEPSLFRSVVQ
jgi:hypothetical protein